MNDLPLTPDTSAPSAGARARAGPPGAPSGPRAGERPPGARAPAEGAREGARARQGEDAAERGVGARPDEEGREGEAEDASAPRPPGEEARRGQTETALSPRCAVKVSGRPVGRGMVFICYDALMCQEGDRLVENSPH
ncbi:hypothetical protein EYF80_066470 [Liparis tanakae]|uniref:Uncharacterized protein n=1 Tax=Liparis tanakae TaxID=230148 RepID=A0A4Z2E4A4_9TELE|nr:hypothetical protein EYF80_066470 [Liparis tanakae]